MSGVYISEPGTTARVLFETTHGPLEISLWCRECPLVTKLFLQLCMDGFYNGMVFHRIVSNFLIQTGAIRNSSKAKEETISNNSGFTSAYQEQVNASLVCERRKYETHARIRFNHRGQVAMALKLPKTNNNDDRGPSNDEENMMELLPQFFITLEEAPYLDGQHVLFGTVQGPTIFNAIRIGKLGPDQEENNENNQIRLEDAPRILKTTIVENTIHTLLAQSKLIPWKKDQADSNMKSKKKKKRKAVKNVNVLSFGDELEDGEQQPQSLKPNLKAKNDQNQSKHDETKKSQKKKKKKKRDHEQVEEEEQEENHPVNTDKNGQVLEKTLPSANDEGKTENTVDENIKEPLVVSNKKRRHDDMNYDEMKGNTPQEPATKENNDTWKTTTTTDSSKTFEEPAMSLVQARRAKYLKGKQNKRQRQDHTMSKLSAFRSKVQTTISKTKQNPDENGDDDLASRMARRMQQKDETLPDNVAPSYHGQVLHHDNTIHGRDKEWMAASFKCRQHVDFHNQHGDGIIPNDDNDDDDRGGDGRHMDDYEVIDERHKRQQHRRPHERGNREDRRKMSHGRHRK